MSQLLMLYIRSNAFISQENSKKQNAFYTLKSNTWFQLFCREVMKKKEEKKRQFMQRSCSLTCVIPRVGLREGSGEAGLEKQQG